MVWMGDDPASMNSFRCLYDDAVNVMGPKLPDETLMDILAKKMRASKVLKSDLDHWERCEDDHEHKCHAWLRGRIDAYLLKIYQETSQTEKKTP